MNLLRVSLKFIQIISVKKMTKEKQVTVKMDARQAAAVRQILFDAQKGYTYDEVSVPPRIADVRAVIQDLDEKIGEVVSD